MNVTRRLALSILAGGCATVIPAGAGWTAAEPEAKPRIPAFGIPRGTLVSMLGPMPPTTITAEGQHLQRLPIFVDMISTGRELVQADSPEGEAIALERAVNLRSDGTIRHRQHHWPRN